MNAGPPPWPLEAPCLLSRHKRGVLLHSLDQMQHDDAA